MTRFIGIIVVGLLFAPPFAYAQQGIQTLDQWSATTTPSSAITQRTFGKAIKITGLSTGACLTLDSNNILTTTTCGGGGGGTAWPFTKSTNYGQSVQSTSTPIFDTAGFQASSTSYFSGASSTLQTIGTLWLTGISNSIVAVDSAGKLIATTTSAGGVTAVSGTWPILSTGGATPVISWDGLSTTTPFTAGQVVYASSGKTVTTVATSSLGVTGPITFSGTLGAQIGGATGSFGCATCVLTTRSINSTWPLTGGGNLSTDLTLAFAGLSTTSPWTAGQLAYVNSSNAVTSVATSSVTISAPLTSTGTAGAVVGGSSWAIGCQTASGSQAGCLSSADWTTFNSKQAALSFTYPLQNITNTVSIAFGTTTSNTWAGTQTFTNASTSVFSISGTWYAPQNGVLLGNNGGAVSAASTQTCTNQFVRALSNTYIATCATIGASDVSLANLSATDSTLTFSGTYNGSTARTIGINLSNGNAWTALQTFTNATATSLTASTNFWLPNAADPSVNATGLIALNTTAASSSIRTNDGTAERSLPFSTPRSLILASSTLAYLSTGFGATGSTSINVMNSTYPATITRFYCKTTAGTVMVRFGTGSASTTALTCNTTGTDSGTSLSNNAFTMFQNILLEVGSASSFTGTVTITTMLRNDAD